MKKKIKICFVLVNRANYGRVKLLMSEIKKKKDLELQLVLVSSPLLKKYGQLDEIIKKDGFKINASFFTHVEGENLYTMTKSTALCLLELSSCFKILSPDIVFTIGDRYESLATAIAASYSNLYLCHLQGGELSGSIDDRVRHAITKLSNLHLVATERSKRIVISMGEKPKNVFNVGCPSIDLIKKINFREKPDLQKYKYGVGHKLDLSRPYFVILLHPVTTSYIENYDLINNVIEAISNIKIQIAWLWPNNDAGANFITKKIRSFREKNNNLKINFFTNLETEDYLKLIKNSKCLIGNSSSGIREGAFLKVPTVNIGDRQDLRERGDNVLDVVVNSKKILKAITVISQKKIKKSKLYGNGNSTKKIIKILRSVKLNNNKSFFIK
jgi:UDP-hydrolysing UDP-N-acetyl-D-glucosamine 2-epimerase